MKNLICTLLSVCILFAGCAGTDPNPIAMYLPSDEKKSCSALKAEISNIDKQVTRKQAQKSKINSKQLVIGMNKDEVLIVMQKLPDNINKTVGIQSIYEQYVYDSRVSSTYIYSPVYLYFEDGILTSWQD